MTFGELEGMLYTPNFIKTGNGIEQDILSR